MNNYLELLKNGLEKLSLMYNEESIKNFEKYTNLLLEYNEKINLTAITDKEEIVIKHYLDSVSLLKYEEIKENTKIIDIGTGAGFPLVPVKILRKDIDTTLLDSLNKRIIFLEKLKEELDLKNIKIVHARAEEYAKDEEYEEKYDYVVIRAVASLNILVEYASSYLKKGGKIIALKGTKADEEIKESEKALKLLNLKLEKVHDVEIPFSDLRHKIVVIKKIDTTPKKYPRSFAQIKKNPL